MTPLEEARADLEHCRREHAAAVRRRDDYDGNNPDKHQAAVRRAAEALELARARVALLGGVDDSQGPT